MTVFPEDVQLVTLTRGQYEADILEAKRKAWEAGYLAGASANWNGEATNPYEEAAK